MAYFELQLPPIGFDGPDPWHYVIEQFETPISLESSLVSENCDALACQELNENYRHNQKEAVEDLHP